MAERLIRIYKSLNIKETQKHLLICGDLTAQCANCNTMDLKFDSVRCPNVDCATTFHYLAFRNIKQHMPKIKKLLEERSDLVLIDHEDFKRLQGELKAKDFLK